jgi:tetratricopeptide (TPR) repeat protein
MAAIPARYALERRDWPEAAALAPVGVEFPWERFPWASAMTAFARALGAAHVGDIATARRELAALQGFEDKLVEAKNDYWANQVEVERLGAAAVLAHVEGDGPRALELSRAAAELEQSMDKHPATPGAVLPAGELRAEILLERNDAAAALKEYQAVLRSDPNRFRSVLGMARAAKLAGDRATAQEAYQRLVTLCVNADTARPELDEARRFLAQ